MITKDNLRELLLSLGFVKDTTNINDVMTRRFSENDTQISVDFSTNQIIYPKEIKIERATTLNFSDNENFVVFECVCRLLKIGYHPSNIVLEPKTPGGREDGNYYGDILITGNDGVPFMLIECKTTGDDKDEYNKEWHRMLLDGGQLFRYYNSYRQANYICLYTADLINGISQTAYRVIKMTDNEERISSDKDLISYSSVTSNGGDYREYFNVWKDTYEYDYLTRGAFDKKFDVRENSYDASSDLREVDSEEIKKKYNEFAVILRQHNVGSHENAFDKLVNLFLAKVVDETNNPNDLHFYWKGTSYDDDFSLQDRLQRLYRDGMKKFLGEDVTYIENSEIDKAFRWVVNDLDATKKTIKEYFRALKFFSDNDFAFISVHNERLFKQNAIVLRKIVKMLQDIRLRTSENYQNQLLGDLFEGFLNKGVKQSEGQFFTPMPIVRFIVSSLPLEDIIKNSQEPPLAIDYACGAGHFLTEYAFRIKEFVEKYYGNSRLKDYYANIYGIEKEYRLSKVSKVSAFMYGHDDTNIIYADALDEIKELRDGTFSVLVANPPYSVSGFLETLSEKQRKRYSIFNDDINVDKNNAIETFFIERAAQLLKSGGVAGIVLPVSVLTKDGIYSRAREVILKSFDLISLVKFDKGTFGKTSTNTVVLFLRRKETNTSESEHYWCRVEDWFSGRAESDSIYKDSHLLAAYCCHMGYNVDDYMHFLKGYIEDSLQYTEMFKSYHRAFFGNGRNAMSGVLEAAKKIRTRFKSQEKSKAFKNKTAEEQDKIRRETFHSFVKAIEQDKLFFFMLAYNAPCPVLIVKMPSGTSEGKRFLGYEWSNTKGNEGIKYLHIGTSTNSTDDNNSDNEADDDTMQQIRGINGIVTPLFNPENLTDTNKINSLIRCNFIGEDYIIPDDCGEYCTFGNLVDMLDFKSVGFKKEFKTNFAFSFRPKTKYPIVKLGDILDGINGETTKIDTNKIQETGRYPVITQEKGIVVSGYYDDKPITDVPLIVFGDHSCTFKYLDEPFVRGADGTQLIKISDSSISLKYLYFYLSSLDIINHGKYERHFKYLKNYFIPKPNTAIQNKIVKECSQLDREYRIIEDEIQELNARILSLQNNIKGNNISLAVIMPFAKKRIPYSQIEADSFVSTDNMLPECAGVRPYNGLPEITNVIAYYPGDILLSNIRPYLKKLWLADREGGCNPDVLVLHNLNPQKVDSAFVYYALRRNEFFDYIMQDVSGMKMPRGRKDTIEKFEIVLPKDIEEQRRIASEFIAIDTKIAKLRGIQEQIPSKKQAILDKYLK
ncbi:MAG TPA: hypothetical protein DCE24_04620 [Porphyromonadaceae bacterium]|nr:hypothetical protein [Porphyromonadaceae bacterium]